MISRPGGESYLSGPRNSPARFFVGVFRFSFLCDEKTEKANKKGVNIRPPSFYSSILPTKYGVCALPYSVLASDWGGLSAYLWRLINSRFVFYDPSYP